MKRLLPLLLLAGCVNPDAWKPPAPPGPPPGDPHKPAAIETVGVPRVPESVVQRLRQYQNVRSASFLDWAPDGQGMLVSTRFANTTQLHRVPMPGGRREQLTFLEEPVSSARYTRDGAILFTAATGGSENWQVSRLDPASGRITLLTDGRSRHELGPSARTSDRSVLGVNPPGARDTDLFLLDPARPAVLEPLKKAEGGFWGVDDWSPDDSKVLLSRHVSVNESWLHVMDLATRALTAVPVPGGGPAAHGDARFSADGRSLYVVSDAAGEFQSLARVDLATMAYEWLTSDLPWDVGAVELSPDGSTVAFTLNEDGMSRLYLLKDGARTAVELPMGIVSGLGYSPDGRRLGLTINRPEAPSDAWSIEEGRLVRWTWSELGGLDPATFVKPERISYPSFDGRQIPAYFYRPAAAGRVPVIISIHGGPESQSRPWFSSSIQFNAADLGCAVLVPNVRGSTGYGKTYVALDNAEKREDSVRDIGALLDWIAARPDLDASRVAVIGGSYGGYMVLASLVHYGERLRAGVDIVGIADFTTFLKNTSAYRQDLRRVEYGDERDPKMQEVFRRISPANHAGRIRSALLVAHGKNDPRVPFSEAERIASVVREGGRPVWTVYAANEGHGFQKKENGDYLSAVIALFLQEHLLKK